MAVENKYVDSNLASGDKQEPVASGGGHIVTVIKTFEVAVADDDGSVYRVFRVPSNGIPLPNGKVYHDSITGGTDYEFGLWDVGTDGAAIDIDCFLGSTTMANTTTLDPFSLAMTVDNATKAFWQYDPNVTVDPRKEYDWGIIGNTSGSGGGTITVVAQYLKQG